MTKLVSYKHNGITKWRREEGAVQTTAGVLRDYMGESIREARKGRSMTLKDCTGVSVAYMSEVERGKKESSSEILEAICDSLNIKMSDLLRTTADKLEQAGK